MDLKASLAVLYRNLQQAVTHDGVVPTAAFEAATSELPLDDASRARLLAELARMGLRIQPQAVQLSPSPDTRHVKKVVRPHTELSQPDHTVRPRVRTAFDLLTRYADNGTVTAPAVFGVARLTGLTPDETEALKASAEARYRVLQGAPSARTGGAREREAADAGPASPAVSITGPVGDLAAAIAAAMAVMNEDRFTGQPAKRILTAAEEVGLVVLVRGGTDRIAVEPTREELGELPATDLRRRARDCLILHNQGLAHSIARGYLDQGLDYEDVFQHAVLGLMAASRKFDPLHGNKFSTYATWWVRQAVSRAIANEGRAIRVPVHFHELMRQVAYAERALQAAGKPRRAADLAVACDLPVSKVEEILKLSRPTDSLDRIIGDGTHLGELLEIRTALPSVEAAVLESMGNQQVRELVALLPDRYGLVVSRRLGLDGEEPATLDVIGAELGVTRERVRQLEAMALPLLRLLLRYPAWRPEVALSTMLREAQRSGVGNLVGALAKDLKEPEWSTGIDALQRFRSREGHACPVESHVEGDVRLGEWVARQRLEGGQGGSRLRVSRRILLDALGVLSTEVGDGSLG